MVVDFEYNTTSKRQTTGGDLWLPAAGSCRVTVKCERFCDFNSVHRDRGKNGSRKMPLVQCSNVQYSAVNCAVH